MDAAADEDKKQPFDEDAPNDDDHQPDPQEHLMLDQGNGRVWLVKIPKALMERWSAVNAEDVHLATLRVYETPASGKAPRIILFLPQTQGARKNPRRPEFGPNTLPTLSSDPDCYELDMVNDAVENQIVVAERVKDASFNLSGAPTGPQPANSRARTTILTGRVKHECNLRPGFTENYRKQMRERHRKYNTPQRTIQMMEDSGMSRAGINRLTSGVAQNTGTFGDLIAAKPKTRGKGTERMARMPRNQLLDLIFQMFKNPPRWAIKDLRQRTQQPAAYLKEVLLEVAYLHKSGEHTGLYELQDIYKADSMKAESVPMPSLNGLTKMEEEDDGMDDDDEDDDDDMEQVS
ncbi:hypothetical protein CYLTODRAFT_417851 [Cylindrobasidium torrendii FP15055 ss-10]|uniref:Transcription initiation factor IIF subunit beta n=1 Tax=Cylindrobasidium torrendii FP15055 ss-10 TaxID=1314674 RepID=A0A0D7BPU4_9AGAR|nr:hypothetical protein CYLTODRAFT_417851 [Cylindrobasidium torrendii FP15055 ss-10]